MIYDIWLYHRILELKYYVQENTNVSLFKKRKYDIFFIKNEEKLNENLKYSNQLFFWQFYFNEIISLFEIFRCFLPFTPVILFIFLFANCKKH